MKTLQRQRGILDIAPTSAPKTPQTLPDRDPDGSEQEFKKRPVRSLFRFGVALAAIAGALLLFWILSMFRYEIITVSTTVGTVQYIVKDRWSDQIEVVWLNPDGQVKKRYLQPFE